MLFLLLLVIFVIISWSLDDPEVQLFFSFYSLCIPLSHHQAFNFALSLILLLSLEISSVRVSNELGRGNSKAAKFSIVNIVLTSFAIGFTLFIFFLFFRGRLAYIFTESSEVAAAVANLSPLLACSILMNSVQPVLSGNLLLSVQQLYLWLYHDGNKYV